jgi:copper chaperone CopZ
MYCYDRERGVSMDSTTFLIPVMTVNDVSLIQNELQQIDGVRAVQIHQPTHSVTVTWTKPDTLDAVWKYTERRKGKLLCVFLFGSCVRPHEPVLHPNG